jgi:hypothetical protein
MATASAIRITYNGKLALTTLQAARRYDLKPAAMRKAISRLPVQPLPESLDDRTPLYLASELDAAMKARPGKGSNLRGRAAMAERLRASTPPGRRR